MFKIGEFARLSRVSVKALRYYDEIGLLRPAAVDRYNGYRYYTADQFPRLTRILALRDLGLSLDQVAALFNQDLSSAQVEAMLLLKRAELKRSAAEIAEQIARIEARLKLIEQEGVMSDYDVVIKAVAPVRAAVAYGVVHDENEIGATFGRLFDEAGEYVKQQGARFTGLGFALWLDPGEPGSEQETRVAAAIPTSAPLAVDGHIRVEDLEGVETMACTVHHGSFASLGAAYKALMQWIERNGYMVAGPNRELYLNYDREGEGRDYVTEIQFPVARAA